MAGTLATDLPSLAPGRLAAVLPVIPGAGKRLFPDPGHAADLRIAQTSTAGETIIVICEPARGETP